ncbi:hypothetical protein QJ043_02470 [Olsenella sp. YH-ols2217]|uniref:DUF3899 domain-containing protein n=1 Tax=Kribbibacterium absianum TaxID=3044210 RepID=A0ABT6ZIR0_9ACTN|nr:MULTISPECIES: hypothetical protein [unclassified Olsenella]MDJ1121457.1 hypothetical protein [Olsenella sp. YH-ols2216]MDJ1128947.1 hypothetical protein [Olsenella sp. YH-ols2217]
MGRAIALCLFPALLACLSLALAFESALAGLSWIVVAVISAAGVCFALSCVRMVGGQMMGSFRKELQRRGGAEKDVVSQEEAGSRTRSALALGGVGAVLLAAGFLLGGAPLVSILSFLATL